MALILNIKINGLPSAKQNLRYTIFDSVDSATENMNVIGRGVIDVPLTGEAVIPFDGRALGTYVGVYFDEFSGSNSATAKGARVWLPVTDDGTPTDPVELTLLYQFSSSDSDNLSLDEEFTGEFKIAWASDSTTGVNQNLIDSLESAFVSTSDYQSPKWNYSIFNGSNKWTLNGRSYAIFDSVILNKNWLIGIDCAGLQDDDEVISGGDGESDSINIDVTSGGIRAFAKVGTDTVGLITLPFTGVNDSITLGCDSAGLATLTVNGTSATADWSTLNGAQVINVIAKRGTSTSKAGTYTNFFYQTGGVTRTFPMLEGYREDRAFFDTTGEIKGTKVKDALVDYTVIKGIKSVVGASFNGVIAKYAKDGEWFGINAGSNVDVYLPQPQISVVAMLGASIEDAAIAGNEGLMEKMLYDHGLPNITFRDESTGGRHIDEIQDHWDAEAEARYTALGNEVLVFTHMFANDIIGNNPYSTTSAAIRTKLIGWANDLVTSITDNGNVPLMVESTFQSFSSPKMSLVSWTDESLGSKPFNDNMLNPITQALNPPQWIDSTSSPYVTTYNWSYNYMKLLSTDGTHWGQVGTGLMRRLWADQIAHYLKGIAPIIVEKMTAEEAFNFIAPPLPVLLAPAPTTEVSPHKELVGGNYWQFTVNNTAKPLIPLHGYVPCSLTVTSAADVMTHGSNTTGVFKFTGQYAATLEHHILKLYYTFTQSTDYVDLMVIDGLNPNQSALLGFASYYSAVDNRRIEFSVNGDEVNTVTCNASYGHADNVKKAVFTANASGQLIIRCRKSSGYIAHFNGLEITPL